LGNGKIKRVAVAAAKSAVKAEMSPVLRRLNELSKLVKGIAEESHKKVELPPKPSPVGSEDWLRETLKTDGKTMEDYMAMGETERFEYTHRHIWDPQRVRDVSGDARALIAMPSNRKEIERVFKARGVKQGDTVQSVLREAQTLDKGDSQWRNTRSAS